VYRGYGTFHEQEAIDMYERQYGWEIRDRNSVMVKWPFIRSEDVLQHQDNTTTTKKVLRTSHCSRISANIRSFNKCYQI
jgi:hypothetical protein